MEHLHDTYLPIMINKQVIMWYRVIYNDYTPHQALTGAYVNTSQIYECKSTGCYNCHKQKKKTPFWHFYYRSVWFRTHCDNAWFGTLDIPPKSTVNGEPVSRSSSPFSNLCSSVFISHLNAKRMNTRQGFSCHGNLPMILDVLINHAGDHYGNDCVVPRWNEH